MLLLVSIKNCDFIKNLVLEKIINIIQQINTIDRMIGEYGNSAIENFLIGNNFTAIEKDEYISKNHICHEVIDKKILMILPTNGDRVFPVDKFLANTGNIFGGI